MILLLTLTMRLKRCSGDACMDEKALLERNKRVEADKAWETSKTRRAIIAAITYVVVGFYLSLLDVSFAWLHAFVPPAAYLLSTLSLVYIKQLWIERFYEN